LLGAIGALVDATANRSGTVEGSRSWKECEELDAKDLMLIASLVLPD
jgi:hypothetical protein